MASAYKWEIFTFLKKEFDRNATCKAWKQLKISLSIFRIIINNTISITHGAFIIQCFQKEFNIAVSHSKQEKDRCGDELIVQDIWQQIGGKNYNYPVL